MSHQYERPSIIFDGICNLCNWVVRITSRKRARFNYIVLQSETGKGILAQYGISGEAGNSVVLLEKDRVYTKSAAILRIFHILGGWWRVLLLFKIIPVSCRDFLYDIIARNRYRLFGKSRGCRMTYKVGE